MPRINAASDRIREGDHAARRSFAALHRLSVVINVAQLFGAGVVVLRLAAGQ